MQAAHPLRRALPGNNPDQAYKRNPRSVHVILGLDASYHAVKTVSAPSQHGDWNQQGNKTNRDQQQPPHSAPPFVFSLSLALSFSLSFALEPDSTSPSTPSPP